MAWIRVVDEEKASGQLKKVYDELERKRGKIANIMKIHSLNPQAMKDHLNLYVTLMFEQSNLTREERELIAVVVSSINHCKYCTTHHSKALNNYWKDAGLLDQLVHDFKLVELPERSREMLKYAVKLTKSPDAISLADIEKLRRYGFKDEDILNINLIASYFNFVNRIALGLGVESTPEEAQGYNV